jgi:hypothetical protein
VGWQQDTMVRMLKGRIDAGMFAVISAHRSDRSDQDNRMNDDALAHFLRGSKRLWYRTDGSYLLDDGSRVFEPGYLVLGLSEREAWRLGHEYDQESVLVDAKLLQTNQPTYNPMSRVKFDPAHTIYGEAALAQPFYTLVHVRGQGEIAFSMQP